MSKKLKKLRLHPRFLPILAVVALVATISVAGVRAASQDDLLSRIVSETSRLLAGEILQQEAVANVNAPADDQTFGVAASESLIQPLGRSRVTTKECFSAGETQTCIEEWTMTGTISAASSTFMSLYNNHAGEVILKKAVIWLDGTTSSTTRFSMGTSTSALAPDYNATGSSIQRGIFNEVSVTTGTPNAIIDSLFDMTANEGYTTHSSSTMVRIPSLGYLVGYMSTGGSNIIQGSSVTSTAGRGFSANSVWWLEFQRISTSTIQ